MADVFDVAKYILEKKGEMTAVKLQKLVYYCQAWSLVWDEKPLFSNKIRAWANGPVVPELYIAHKGLYYVNSSNINGDPNKLELEEMETIEAVLNVYGNKTSQWLSNLTHIEPPWKNARIGLQMGERGNKEISQADMAEYYGSL